MSVVSYPVLFLFHRNPRRLHGKGKAAVLFHQNPSSPCACLHPHPPHNYVPYVVLLIFSPRQGMNVAVAGIPKTIDNDVDYIDRSFGFESAVEAAQVAIRSAKTEAICNMPNGVGIVKLMGRSAGFIAAHATMASGDVDLCLVPEVPIVLEGERGCLPHIMRRVKDQGYAVIVVAEGAGEELLGTSAEVDAGGNKKLPPIGTFMKEKVEAYFQENGAVATVKYIDPSYTVRSCPANAQDSLCKWDVKECVVWDRWLFFEDTVIIQPLIILVFCTVFHLS